MAILVPGLRHEQRVGARREQLVCGAQRRNAAGGLPGLAETGLAEEELAIPLEQADQRDGHAEQPRQEPGEPVEVLLRGSVEQPEPA